MSLPAAGCPERRAYPTGRALRGQPVPHRGLVQQTSSSLEALDVDRLVLFDAAHVQILRPFDPGLCFGADVTSQMQAHAVPTDCARQDNDRTVQAHEGFKSTELFRKRSVIRSIRRSRFDLVFHIDNPASRCPPDCKRTLARVGVDIDGFEHAFDEPPVPVNRPAISVASLSAGPGGVRVDFQLAGIRGNPDDRQVVVLAEVRNRSR